MQIQRPRFKERGKGYLGFPWARRRQDLGQGVDLRRALVAFGKQHVHDEVQGDTASFPVWSSLSIVSRGGRERRLEVHRRRCASGDHWGARSAAVLGEPRAWGGAPEEGEEDRRERGTRGSLISSVTSGDGGGSYGFRWWISGHLIDAFEREQRGSAEETVGYL
jgi:hypothetical protein